MNKLERDEHKNLLYSMEENQNSIEQAINDCQNKIENHKVQARKSLSLVIYSLFFFGMVVTFGYVINIYNQNRLNYSLERAKNLSESFEGQLKKAEIGIRTLVQINKMLSSRMKQDSEYSDNDRLLDNYNSKVDSAYATYDFIGLSIASIKTLPTEMSSSILHYDSSIQYILYGIFILVFGVSTSFYRYHLKETSKYEHFLFGLYRIRIAANNSVSGFEDEVRNSLTKDAFLFEGNTSLFRKDKKVESPIPGHVTSDFAAILFNKIIDTIDITAKARDKKKDID